MGLPQVLCGEAEPPRSQPRCRPKALCSALESPGPSRPHPTHQATAQRLPPAPPRCCSSAYAPAGPRA